MTNKELEKRVLELEEQIKVLKNTPNYKGLNNYTPQELKELAESGNANKFLNIGDTVEIELITGSKAKFAILGFNHDTKLDGSKNGITFGLLDCFDVLVRYNHDYYTNKGGWKYSYIRELCQRIIKLLPQEWQEIISTVEKITYCDGDKQVTQDKIFINSKTEVFGRNNGGIAEGEQYEYYKNDKNIIKCCNGNRIWWLLRSPYSGSSNYVSGVGSGGLISYITAGSSFYASPCFVL